MVFESKREVSYKVITGVMNICSPQNIRIVVSELGHRVRSHSSCNMRSLSIFASSILVALLVRPLIQYIHLELMLRLIIVMYEHHLHCLALRVVASLITEDLHFMILWEFFMHSRYQKLKIIL